MQTSRWKRCRLFAKHFSMFDSSGSDPCWGWSCSKQSVQKPTNRIVGAWRGRTREAEEDAAVQMVISSTENFWKQQDLIAFISWPLVEFLFNLWCYKQTQCTGFAVAIQIKLKLHKSVRSSELYELCRFAFIAKRRTIVFCGKFKMHRKQANLARVIIFLWYENPSFVMFCVVQYT